LKKLGIEGARLKIFNINKDIEVISSLYENNQTPLALRCKKCGHIWENCLNNIRKSLKCENCREKAVKLTIEDIIEASKINSPNITILSKDYKDPNVKLKCECDICGHLFERHYRGLTRGTKCPECSKNSPSKTNRRFTKSLTKEIVMDRLSKATKYTIINFDDFKNSNSKLRCECRICGEKWLGNIYLLEKGHKCSKCAKQKSGDSLRYDIDKIKEDLLKITDKIIILSNHYENTLSELEVKCTSCGETWTTNWKHLKQYQSCGKCSVRYNVGENHPEWKGGVTPIYEYLRNCIGTWKNDSKVYSGYRCVITGDEYDVVHHVYGFNKIAEETLKLCDLPAMEMIAMYTEEELTLLKETCLRLHYDHGLGVCLTKEIHNIFHNEYGRGDNTYEQFEEFKKNYKS